MQRFFGVDLWLWFGVFKVCLVSNLFILDSDRGISRVSVCLSWQVPLYSRHSVLKLIKYQTMSLKVSNADGMDQATAFPFSHFSHFLVLILCCKIVRAIVTQSSFSAVVLQVIIVFETPSILSTADCQHPVCTWTVGICMDKQLSLL